MRRSTTNAKLGFLVLCLSLFSLVLAACGATNTPVPAPTTAQATTAPAVSTTAPAPTVAPATTAPAAPTAAPTNPPATTAPSVSGEVVVFAASSLTDAFNEIKAEIEKANPNLKITLNYGASSALRTQLEQGAKADIFASADQTQMDNATKANLVEGKGTVFVRNRLVVIVPKNNPGKVTKLQDLANTGLKFVTAQKEVPIGAYTLDALDKMSKDATFGADFSTKVQANIVSREANVKQVVSKVQLGEADAAIVYTTDVTASVASQISTLEIPDQFNTIATYPISALKAASNTTGAKFFTDYVLGSPGQAILKKYNFLTVTSGNTGGSTAASAPKPSTSFQLSGLVNKAGEFKLDDLKALPKATVTTNPQAAGQPMGQYTYGGSLLYDLLQKAEVKTDPNRKNDILRKIIVVTGSDGYSVAIAWGEIDPKFAAKKILVAYERNEQPLPPEDGFARLIVPGDTAAGRYVSNVVKIELQEPTTAPTVGERKASTTFNLSGLVNNSGDYNLDKLKGLKTTEVTIETKDAQGTVTKTVYGGVLLNDLLTSAGIKLDAAKKNDILRKGIVAIGADGYSSVVVGGEIDPKFANAQILVAFSKDGQPLADSDGFARLVVAGDAAQGRYVSNLVKLEVFDPK